MCKFVFRLAFVLYLLLILAAMCLPFRRMGVDVPSGLKGEAWPELLIHFLAFLPWMVGAFAVWGGRLRWGLALGLGAVLVLALELVQTEVPSRGFSWDDLLCGGLGLLCSFALARCLFHWRVWRD